MDEDSNATPTALGFLGGLVAGGLICGLMVMVLLVPIHVCITRKLKRTIDYLSTIVIHRNAQLANEMAANDELPPPYEYVQDRVHTSIDLPSYQLTQETTIDPQQIMDGVEFSQLTEEVIVDPDNSMDRAPR